MAVEIAAFGRVGQAVGVLVVAGLGQGRLDGGHLIGEDRKSADNPDRVARTSSATSRSGRPVDCELAGSKVIGSTPGQGPQGGEFLGELR